MDFGLALHEVFDVPIFVFEFAFFLLVWFLIFWFWVKLISLFT